MMVDEWHSVRRSIGRLAVDERDRLTLVEKLTLEDALRVIARHVQRKP